MRCITVANQKGGVGKTVTVQNLAAALAELEHRVLVVDLDPQSNLSMNAGVVLARQTPSMFEVLVNEQPIRDAIQSSEQGFDVAPSRPVLMRAEAELKANPGWVRRLRHALADVASQYDFCIIDTPPTIVSLTVTGLVAADAGVVVPFNPSPNAIAGLQLVLARMEELRSENPELRVIAALPSRVERWRVESTILDRVREQFPALPAVEVATDRGSVLLELGRSVEVRVQQRIVDRRPEQLKGGEVLLIGRRQGRVGLLEALEERLAHRPDLLAARLLIDRYHQLVRTRFADSGLKFVDLHRELSSIGCDKTSFATRSWVTEGGIMAPRDLIDLHRLNTVLGLGMSDAQLNDLFACVKRRRVFRRGAGRALAEAARSATLVDDHLRVDAETGLSIADLRDAVIEATVLKVSPCHDLVPLTLLGRLESS